MSCWFNNKGWYKNEDTVPLEIYHQTEEVIRRRTIYKSASLRRYQTIYYLGRFTNNCPVPNAISSTHSSSLGGSEWSSKD